MSSMGPLWLYAPQLCDQGSLESIAHRYSLISYIFRCSECLQSEPSSYPKPLNRMPSQICCFHPTAQAPRTAAVWLSRSRNSTCRTRSQNSTAENCSIEKGNNMDIHRRPLQKLPLLCGPIHAHPGLRCNSSVADICKHPITMHDISNQYHQRKVSYGKSNLLLPLPLVESLGGNLAQICSQEELGVS